MQPFTFRYKSEIRKSQAARFMDEGYQCFLVTTSSGLELTIVPSGLPGSENKTIWVQTHKPGEKIHPHDLVQALGEGLENAGIYTETGNRSKSL
jgi:hypothetical protein